MGFQRVLIAVDGSPIAIHAMEVGAELAKALGAQIALVHVVDPKLASAPEGGFPASAILDNLRQEGRQLLESASRRIEGEPPPREYLVEGSPSREIITLATEWNADLIVLGTHGRSGIARAFFGSTAEGVVRHSQIPVLTVRAASR
jgi:nucleotide-binding universal stress UspA family protein